MIGVHKIKLSLGHQVDAHQMQSTARLTNGPPDMPAPVPLTIDDHSEVTLTLPPNSSAPNPSSIASAEGMLQDVPEKEVYHPPNLGPPPRQKSPGRREVPRAVENRSRFSELGPPPQQKPPGRSGTLSSKPKGPSSLGKPPEAADHMMSPNATNSSNPMMAKQVTLLDVKSQYTHSVKQSPTSNRRISTELKPTADASGKAGGPRTEILKGLFDVLDRDRTGGVSRAVLMQAIRTDEDVRDLLGLPVQLTTVNRSAIERVFHAIESDNSSGLTFEEFCAAVHRLWEHSSVSLALNDDVTGASDLGSEEIVCGSDFEHHLGSASSDFESEDLVDDSGLETHAHSERVQIGLANGGENVQEAGRANSEDCSSESETSGYNVLLRKIEHKKKLLIAARHETSVTISETVARLSTSSPPQGFKHIYINDKGRKRAGDAADTRRVASNVESSGKAGGPSTEHILSSIAPNDDETGASDLGSEEIVCGSDFE
eukprot:SAG31_NODE_5067_length_2761_cov_53.365890_1_plen_485_part_10